ncbi:putative Ig domain-containing protein [Spirosoma sordidisoli]|uniref:Uncharacterized protein n=1 Tax=Spirosoma sordidisoli TaxID=2502893 RepID=A0A4Q2USJ6_9BACT|nr:putative Ig domain-containing protein [Spirosoma sordidisoli]RYC70851.1 hypothetical protein EQG79_01485 [Spirosoma sordidisoli]
MPIREIDSGDLVNAGRDKVNESLGEVPTQFELTPEGDLIITKHNGQTITIPFKNVFAALGTIFDSIAIGQATDEVPGTVLLVNEDDTAQFEAENRVLTAAQVGRLIVQIKDSFEEVSLDDTIFVDPVTDKTPYFKGSLKGTLKPLPAGMTAKAVVVGTDDEFYTGSASAGGGTNPTPTKTYRAGELYKWKAPNTTPPPTTPNYSGRVDFIDCDRGVGAWVLDLNKPNTPIVARLVIDGVLVETKTAHKPRPDVVANFNLTGTVIPGVEFLLPEWAKDGKQHQIQVLMGPSGSAEVGYNTPNNLLTCAVVPPPNNEPYPVQFKVSGRTAMTKGVPGTSWSVVERLNTGTERAFSGSTAPNWAATPSDDLLLTPNAGAKTVNIDAGPASKNFSLGATVEYNGKAYPAEPLNVQVLDAVCTRPNSGLQSYRLHYNYVKDGMGNPFRTPTEANNVLGQIYDRTLNATLTPNGGFVMQVGQLAKGQTIYNGTGTSCENVSDGIYPVTDINNGNTIKKAIQVFQGKIIDVVDSAYGSNLNRPPVRVVAIGFMAWEVGLPFSVNIPETNFSDPDNDPLQWVLQWRASDTDEWSLSLPSWINFDPPTRRVYGQAPPTAGTHLFRFVVADGRGGYADDPFVFNILPKSTTTAQITGAAIWRQAADKLVFLFRTAQTASLSLEDSWSGEEPFSPGAWLASDYSAPPVSLNRPAGFESYQYYDAYPWRPEYQATLDNEYSVFQVRITGQSTPIFTANLIASNLQIGQVRTIYTS